MYMADEHQLATAAAESVNTTNKTTTKKLQYNVYKYESVSFTTETNINNQAIDKQQQQ